MIYVLDASAMIAFLRGEAGADVVAQCLLDANVKCYAHALNLCEVFYDFARAASREDALDAISDLALVGVIADAGMTPGVWQSAGMLKAELRRVSLADCFALELAERLKATIVTADHNEFDALAARGEYRIQFIR